MSIKIITTVVSFIHTKKITLLLLGIVVAYAIIVAARPQYGFSNGQVCGGFGGETRQFKCQYSERGADSQGTCILSPLFTLNELRMTYIK